MGAMATDPVDFQTRMGTHWPHLRDLLTSIYVDRPDLDVHLAALQEICTRAHQTRSDALKELDQIRLKDPHWFASEQVVGATLYVDLFAGDLNGVRDRIPYLRSLGITFLHLMPLFRCPPNQSDGGYAVSSYREVDGRLGTTDELGQLADELRSHGIALALDFVFNHTSDQHDWALRAKAGEGTYLRYYRTFDSRQVPNAYEETLREIFPSIRRGSFSWCDELQRWVWTSFNSFQWDLNYANPAVFVAMVEEMLFLANTGIDVLRLDAVAFLWKELGTTCENLPQAHSIIQAFNRVCRMVAPAVVFKSEAIVHPDDVARYISPGECPLSYNPTLMALLWEAVATRNTRLLRQSMSHRQALPSGTTWVNYLRCHDDIGWSFDDQDARKVGIDPHGHRRFLNDFYTGRWEGSFARGVPFQFNPSTGDLRICGTLASLVGVEDAISQQNTLYEDMALRRARMLMGVLMSVGGIPLLYMGEELGILNDYSYLSNPDQLEDSRWVHRVAMDWDMVPGSHKHGAIQAAFTSMFQELVEARKKQTVLAGTQIQVLDSPDDRLLVFRRAQNEESLVVIANFSEQRIRLTPDFFGLSGVRGPLKDVLNNSALESQSYIEAYGLHWCQEGTDFDSL